MKTKFQRYYLLFGTLLFVVFSYLFSHSSVKRLDFQKVQADFVSLHFDNHVSNFQKQEKPSDKFFHKDTVNYKFVDHSKANVIDPEFELETTFKFQEFEALLKFVLVAFVFAAVVDFHSRKSALILAKLSHFYTSLNDALYLKFRVIRL